MNTTETSACANVLKYLDYYLNSEVSVELSLEISSHLESCPGCAHELRIRTRLRDRLKTAAIGETVPAGLHSKILTSLHKAQYPRSKMLTSGGYLFAATVLLACVGLGIALKIGGKAPVARNIPPEEYIRELSRNLASPMDVGLADHIHCAVLQILPQNPAPFEEMTKQLGPEYGGLLPLVRDRMPADYTMVTAHKCRFQGRGFVHLVLKGQSALISIVLTRGTPEDGAFATKLAPALTQLGVPIYQQDTKGFVIAGFESPDHLVFLVSDIAGQANLKLAAGLAPAINGYLSRLRG